MTGAWSEAPCPCVPRGRYCTTHPVPQGARPARSRCACLCVWGRTGPCSPSRCTHRVRGVVACDVLEARLGERGEGCTLGFGDVGRPFEGGHVPHVVVLRGNVEITDVGDLRVGVGGEPGGTRIAKSLQPAQFVGVVVMSHLTPVGDVQAPHLDTTTGGCDGSGLGFLGITVPGLSGKPICTSARPTREAIATPFHCDRPWWATSYPRSVKTVAETGRREPWSLGSQGRRRCCGPARPRSVRPGPGRCLHSMSRYAQPKARPPRRRFRTCVASVSGLAPQSRTIVTGSLLVLCPARPALRGCPDTPRDHPPHRYSIPRDRTGDRSITRNRPQAEFTLRDLRRSRQPVEHGSPRARARRPVVQPAS